MFKKLMKHLTNNSGLKILSVVIAVVLWLIVVNYDNPEISKTYTIPITVTNENVLEDMGKVYEVVGQSNMATIYVKGKRSYLDSLSGSDFTATADLSQIDFHTDGNEKYVPINVTAKRYEKYLSITQKSVNMKITLEDLSEEQFYISCDTQGTPAEGYAIGEVAVSPNLIKISGPQSVVSKVSRVAANVNVEGLTDDITVSVVPVLYDENGNVLESTQLRLSQEKVTVNIQILGTKTVPVRCETSGTPADGYQFISLEYAPETIAIKGEPAVLNNIQEIVIPGEAINLEGATGDVENSIDIIPYLEAAGVSLVNSEETKIAVKAIVERLETKNIEIPVEELKLLNIPADCEVTFDETQVRIPVRGRSEELSQLTSDQIKVAVDLKDYSVGDYTVELTITLDEKFHILGTVTIDIHIIKIEEEPTEETAGEPAEDSTEESTEENTQDESGEATPETDSENE